MVLNIILIASYHPVSNGKAQNSAKLNKKRLKYSLMYKEKPELTVSRLTYVQKFCTQYYQRNSS